MNTKQLIRELSSECILTKLEKKEITELLNRGDKFGKIVKDMVEFSESKALKLHVDENELWKFKLKKIIAGYFPNPSTNFTEKVMEKINKEVKK